MVIYIFQCEAAYCIIQNEEVRKFLQYQPLQVAKRNFAEVTNKKGKEGRKKSQRLLNKLPLGSSHMFVAVSSYNVKKRISLNTMLRKIRSFVKNG
jgi:hypothetical protein